ncbi:SDR family NAD(P)-dependent oxidoreductase [Streptosporangium sandarakinum]|uniref:SDR family NAD(P)-dependent oxidoreductase n=1 Tax=Streptosporangium sandarakinum TaxID=1260955 RepID=UPI003D8E70BA
MFSLEGRTALVTGARTGIGRAVAVGLAAAGADLVLHGRDDDLDEVEAEVRGTGRRATRWILDLSDPGRIPEAAERLGPVDVLVNNAGIIRRAPAAGHSYADFRDVLDVNLDAVFLLSRAVGAGMLTRRSGKIIMIASMLSFQGGINVPGHTASKHAVAGLTRALACRVGRLRRAGQRDRPRLHRDGEHPAAARGPGAGGRDRRAHPGGPLGHAGGSRGRGGLPRLLRVRLRQRPSAGGGRRLVGALTSRLAAWSGKAVLLTRRWRCWRRSPSTTA